MSEDTVVLHEPEQFGRNYARHFADVQWRANAVAEAAYYAARGAGFAETAAIEASLAAQSEHLDRQWEILGQPFGVSEEDSDQ